MTLAQRIGSAYLVFLSLLPAAGTVALLAFLDIEINPLLFLTVGTAAVGIYLAVIGSYTKLSSSAAKNALMLLDGPLWATVGVFMDGSLATFIVDEILIETASVLVGLFGVVLTSNKPTTQQRIASVFAVGIPLLGVAWVAWQYIEGFILPHDGRIWLLVAAMAQGIIVNYRLANNDDVHQSAESYIVIGIVAWMAALFAGYGLDWYLNQ